MIDERQDTEDTIMMCHTEMNGKGRGAELQALGVSVWLAYSFFIRLRSPSHPAIRCVHPMPAPLQPLRFLAESLCLGLSSPSRHRDLFQIRGVSSHTTNCLLQMPSCAACLCWPGPPGHRPRQTLRACGARVQGQGG